MLIYKYVGKGCSDILESSHQRLVKQHVVDLKLREADIVICPFSHHVLNL